MSCRATAPRVYEFGTPSPAITVILGGHSDHPGLARHHRFAPPTLGQHNDEILGSIELSHDELDALRRDHVIGGGR